MALRVWLPLNGDFHNQGLDNQINFTTTGTVSDAEGKIGMSKQFASSNIIGNYSFTLGDAASACLWIYYTAFPSASSNDWIFHLGTTSNYSNAVFGLSTYHATLMTVMAGGKYDSSFVHNFELNTWYHIAFVWNNTVGQLYIDGELKQTYTNLNDGTKKAVTKISLGSNVANSSTKLRGRLNDFRFYDHCLSPREIKEISKGLVLHYSLSSGNMINKENVTHNYHLQSNGVAKFSSGWCYTDYIIVYPNSNYICTGLSKGGSGTYVVLYDKTKTMTRSLLITANQDLNITTSETEHYIRLSIREIQNELNTTANFLYLDNVEYDVSGYQNNGISTNISYSNNTPRYYISSVFNGTSSYIKNTDFILTHGIWTVSFWYYLPIKPSGYQTLICLSKDNGADANKKICASANSTYIWYKFENISFTNSNIKIGEWCHIAMTCDGANGKVYENGVLKQTSAAISSVYTDCNDLVVGARANSASAATTAVYLNGNLSDVRIYSTCFSQEDIQKLVERGL